MKLELTASNGDRLPCIGADFRAQRCQEKMFCAGHERNRYGPSLMAAANVSKSADIKQVMGWIGLRFTAKLMFTFCIISI